MRPYNYVEWDKPLFDSLTIEQLDSRGCVIDQLYGNNKLLFLEYVLEGERKEYFRSSDTTFEFRSYIDGEIHEQGQYVYESQHQVNVDTLISNGIPKQIIYVKKYILQRTGPWRKSSKHGIFQSGNYDFGKKTGRWKLLDWHKGLFTIIYKDGYEIGRSKPGPKHIKAYFNKIIGREFGWANSNAPWSVAEFSDRQIWSLSDQKFSKGSPFLLSFNSNGEIDLKIQNSKFRSVGRTTIGNWELQYNQFQIKIYGLTKVFKVDYIGDNRIELKEKQK